MALAFVNSPIQYDNGNNCGNNNFPVRCDIRLNNAPTPPGFPDSGNTNNPNNLDFDVR
jgi:hypothetical protein